MVSSQVRHCLLSNSLKARKGFMFQKSDPATLGSQGRRAAGPQFQHVPRAGATMGRQNLKLCDAGHGAPALRAAPRAPPGAVTKQLAQSAK